VVAAIVLTTVTAVPTLAQSPLTIDSRAERVGVATIVLPKVESLRLLAIEEKTPTDEIRYRPVDEPQQWPTPLYPLWHYTCYFEGVQVPCSAFAWLWF
jgi:hypothetical protein